MLSVRHEGSVQAIIRQKYVPEPLLKTHDVILKTIGIDKFGEERKTGKSHRGNLKTKINIISKRLKSKNMKTIVRVGG